MALEHDLAEARAGRDDAAIVGRLAQHDPATLRRIAEILARAEEDLRTLLAARGMLGDKRRVTYEIVAAMMGWSFALVRDNGLSTAWLAGIFEQLLARSLDMGSFRNAVNDGR